MHNTAYNPLRLNFLSEIQAYVLSSVFNGKILADLHATKPYTNPLARINKNRMTKFIFTILFSLIISLTSYCQEEISFNLDDINISISHSTFSNSPNYIIKVRGYILKADKNTSSGTFLILPDMIKSIEVIKNKEILIQYGFTNDNKLIIIELKNRVWRKLPPTLRAKMEKEK